MMLSGPLLGRSTPLEVKFYPETLRPYELDAMRNLSGVLLQNMVIANGSEKEVRVEHVEMDLMAGNEVIQTHRLRRSELEQAAKKGAMLEKNGLLERLSFQFRPDRLLGTGMTLSAQLELKPRSGLLIGHRFFAFKGTADQITVRVSGIQVTDSTPVQVVGTIPIAADRSKIEYLFPIAGQSFVGAGQALHHGHRWVVPEEFALDILKLGEGSSSHRGDGSKRTDFYAYGTEVLAAADGTVKMTQDGLLETDDNLRQPGETPEKYFQRLLSMQDSLIQKGALVAAGNYITIEHRPREYSFYAHLLPGSLLVKQGEVVKAGQVIARLGHSGNSSEPHLHFHVVDGPDPLMSAGLPVHFKNVSLPYADGPREIQSGDIVEATSVR